VEERDHSGLPAAHQTGRRADRRRLSCREPRGGSAGRSRPCSAAQNFSFSGFHFEIQVAFPHRQRLFLIKIQTVHWRAIGSANHGWAGSSVRGGTPRPWGYACPSRHGVKGIQTMSNCHAAANSYDTRPSPRNQLAADCSSLRAQRSNTCTAKFSTSFAWAIRPVANGSKHAPSRKRQSLGVTARRRRGAGAGGEQMTINVVRIPNLPTLPNLGVGFARSRLSLSALRSPCS